MSEFSEIFGTPQEDGMEPDFNAIFGGEAADAPPIPVEEPKSTDIPATETLAPDVPAAEARSDESAAASAEEIQNPKRRKPPKKPKAKQRNPMQSRIFSRLSMIRAMPLNRLRKERFWRRPPRDRSRSLTSLPCFPTAAPRNRSRTHL